ncbi:phosphatase PAP2 family protein [Stappia sp. F7233]|uniref:Phosphatase PAP2 family protein n=1 Tax=Stappia albiluteola TaxID=2758565 RepID=A0A839AFL3_9HYPH|nr:phosphatase PAP2 family protein [Stappia albiluteola]MBA5778640.1 phosphatase PAP2 family protein [Stappia albiluteola]
MTAASSFSRYLKSLWRFAGRYPLTACLIYIAVISAFFLVFPGVDIAVSRAFWSPETGFPAAQSDFLVRLRHLGPHLVRLIAIAAGAVILVKLAWPDRPPLLPLRVPLFLLSTLALAPGIVVNAVLKDNWGRPRPRMVEIFGGDAPYVPVWHIADYCEKNCSFVSGEASSGIWLVSLAFLVPAAWRKAVVVPTLALAFALSLNRVAFGGHFLSDTMLSWGITLLVILLIHRLLFVHCPRWLGDEALDRALTRAGHRLRRFAAQLADRVKA